MPSESGAILDENGNAVVSYGYDAWGAPLWCTGELAETLGKVQPFRYRGYVFDEETGLYYLRSRYYNPQWGRFVNADAYASTGRKIIDCNMFAYCASNPINKKDPTGNFEIFALIAIATVAFCVASFAERLTEPTSDVGSAQPYIEMPGSDDPTSPNCYAYAIGSPFNEQLGGASGRIPSNWNDVYDVAKSVEADLVVKGYTVRQIAGPDAKVYDNEFKIALRVGTQPFGYDRYTGQPYYDYHFMRQTNTGQWAKKHGCGGASVLWDRGMTPETIPWTLGNVPYYDSAIVYYAIGK